MNELNNVINLNIPDILKNPNNIAIVGLSNRPERSSYRVGMYIKQAGYNIFPVNLSYDIVMDLKCYNTMDEISEPVDIVNIFRRAKDVLPILKDAIKIQAKVIWMQLGIENQEAAKLAVNSGLKVIMNRCIHTML